MKRNSKLPAILSILLIGGILLMCLSACGATKYNVDYGGKKSLFENARDSYRAGAKVKLYYGIIATDTDYSFYVDGKRFNAGYDESKGYIIEFIMPEHDITVSVESRNSMEYIPEENEASKYTLKYDSFDGGGPSYTPEIEDSSLLDYDIEKKYYSENHAEEDGSSFAVNLVFTGLASGSTTVTVKARSPVGINYDEIYRADIDDNLNVNMTLLETKEYD